MDTPKNGRLHRDAGGRPRRSAGWLARAAVSAAFLLGMAFSSTAFAQNQQLPVVTAAKPVVREIVEDDEFVGRFEAVDQVAIRSRVSGYLDKVSFQDGALVNKGDLLFTIDQRPYQRLMMPPNRKWMSPRVCSNSPRCSWIAQTNSPRPAIFQPRRSTTPAGIPFRAGADAGRDGCADDS